MKTFLKGYDLSHWQTDKEFNELLPKSDFIILKATEGKTYTDPNFKNRKDILINKGKRRGYYHYARPENNTVEEEINNFMTAVGTDVQNSLLFLDWEGKALKYDFSWALHFCDMIKDAYGISVAIYASASVVRKYGQEYPYWWVAHYNDDCKDGCEHDGGVKEWITQFTSSNGKLDINTFHGTASDWDKLTWIGKYHMNNWEQVTTYSFDGYDYKLERKKI